MPDKLAPVEALARALDRRLQSQLAGARELRDRNEAERRELRAAAGGILEGDRVFDRVSGERVTVQHMPSNGHAGNGAIFIARDNGDRLIRKRADLVPIAERPDGSGAGTP